MRLADGWLKSEPKTLFFFLKSFQVLHLTMWHTSGWGVPARPRGAPWRWFLSWNISKTKHFVSAAETHVARISQWNPYWRKKHLAARQVSQFSKILKCKILLTNKSPIVICQKSDMSIFEKGSPVCKRPVVKRVLLNILWRKLGGASART